jgi:hypothetical protein
MGILVGGFLVLFGLIFFLVGGGIGLIGDLVSGRGVAGPMGLSHLVFAGVGGLILIIGLIVFLGSFIRLKKKKALAMLIYEQGVPTEGTVTFVDKNYGVLVNQKPIYSIVEFTFKDLSGQEQVARKNDVESDLVIRLKLEVGSKVQVKYLSADPKKNILMLPDPKAVAAG